jgi:CrcB protein
MSAAVWIAVAGLGAVGSIARFAVYALLRAGSLRALPLATLAVNTSGSLVLGLLSGLAVHGTALVLAGTATLGSYTTFSTWMLESYGLAEDVAVRAAIINVALSLIIGLGAAAAGHAIGANL